VTELMDFPRAMLAQLPTPLEGAERLSTALGGARIIIKRDDLTGLAMGGNKARKLELLMAAALASGADTVVTTGASDSNHCRMTAAAAARLGLKCALLLGAKSESPELQGNLLLDRLFGAEIHFYPTNGTVGGNHLLPELTEHIRSRGNRPYTFPSGGSTGLGAIGYALALKELIDQLAARGVRPDYIVHASGSGGTHAGLLLGAALFRPKFQIMAINIDEATNDILEARTRSVYAEGAGLLGLPENHEVPEFILRTGYVGAGYGVISPAGAEAIRLLAQTEGILLDPVYTGKAMAALADLVRNGEMGSDKTVVFIHTGGTPALFTQARQVEQEAQLASANPPMWWGKS